MSKAPLAKLVAKYQQDTLQIYRLACTFITAATVEETPVLNGDLRVSWTPSIGNTPQVKNFYPSQGIQGRHDTNGVINSLKLGETFNFANGQEHARRVEYEGWSAKAPAGMMRVSVANWQRHVDGAARGA